MFSSSLYTRSPIWFQETLISFRESARKLLREGGGFRRALREISETQWFDSREIEEYQAARLRAVIKHAVENVPYYRNLFRDLSLTEKDFDSSSDLAKLPYLTKEDVRRNPSSFVPKGISSMVFRSGTSGTTGTPVTIYQDLGAIAREHAFVHRLLGWSGFRETQRRAWIRGDMVVPAAQQCPPYWRVNRAANMLMMSSYHLSERCVPEYIETLEQWDPVVIQAYPSSIGFLAAYLEFQGSTYRGHALKAIVTSSETLTQGVREVVSQVFGCPVFDHYGSLERVVFISSCEKGNLHVHPDYGIFEEVPAEHGLSGEIVGTGFNNLAMPLLRYRTGDQIVVDRESAPCSCGRHWPRISRVEGRMDDYVVTADGRHVTRLGHIFTGIPGIAEGQIVQDEPGRVAILVVPLSGDTEQVKERLRTRARERFGGTMAVDIVAVSAIERGPNGKLRTVVRRT